MIGDLVIIYDIDLHTQPNPNLSLFAEVVVPTRFSRLFVCWLWNGTCSHQLFQCNYCTMLAGNRFSLLFSLFPFPFPIPMMGNDLGVTHRTRRPFSTDTPSFLSLHAPSIGSRVGSDQINPRSWSHGGTMSLCYTMLSKVQAMKQSR